jgi:peptidoglycan/xylan/chitin deacetylase (PgdA/CDA1 family)
MARRLLVRLALLVAAAALASACGGGGGGSPTPTATGTRTASATPRPAGTPTPGRVTPRPSSTPLPPATPTPFVMPVPQPGWRADGSRSAIALTFDSDGVTGYTAALLATLDAHGARASFALTGVWVQGNPGLARRIVAAGHTVMNHSWDHPDFTTISKAQRLSELARTEDVVRSVTGISTKPFFRPPYGAVNAAVRADAAGAGYATLLWNIDPQGWRGKPWQLIAADVFTNARDGAIALFHVSAAGDAQALGVILETLQDAGYRFVTVAELLGPPRPPARQPPRPPARQPPRPPARQPPRRRLRARVHRHRRQPRRPRPRLPCPRDEGRAAPWFQGSTVAWFRGSKVPALPGSRFWLLA